MDDMENSESSESCGEKAKGIKPHLRQIIITLLIVLVVFAAVNLSVDSFAIEGSSMEPSFHNGEYLMVNKLSYRFGSPDRGDVIVFHYPLSPETLYVKRIIGLPGEKVEIAEGRIYIDGRLLVEPSYISSTYYQGNNFSTLVPKDHYFVLGDNRSHSSDSRLGWTVPRGNIVGNAWVTYWPLGDFGLTPGYSWTLN